MDFRFLLLIGSILPAKVPSWFLQDGRAEGDPNVDISVDMSSTLLVSTSGDVCVVRNNRNGETTCLV